MSAASLLAQAWAIYNGHWQMMVFTVLTLPHQNKLLHNPHQRLFSVRQLQI